MKYLGSHVVLFGMLAISHAGLAQTPIKVDAAALNRHVLTRSTLVYPMIAKADHVQGTVVLQVVVGVTGKVESTQTISGPPMLIQAAKDCVEQWAYRPFEQNGSAVPATASVSFDFKLQGETIAPHGASPDKDPSASIIVVKVKANTPSTPEGILAARFVDAQHECVSQVMSKKNTEATAAICKKAADIAEQLPPDSHYIDKRYAYISAANTLGESGDLINALVYATKAVDVTNLGHDIDSGQSEAYATKGAIEFSLSDLSAADEDLTSSENYGRKAIIWAEKEAPNNTANYKKHLAQVLRFHANVSLHMNHADEASKELVEASKL